MNRRTVRRYAVQGGVVVVVFAAGFGTRMYLAKTPTRTAGFTLTSQTITVSDGSATQSTSASGTIEPKVSDTVNFSTSGTINAVDVTTGQTVKAGQTLATLDSASLSAQVAQAQAQLASAQTRLSDDTSAGASSATIASDNSAVTQATNSLTNAQDALAGATLTSPIAGTVVSVGLTAGTQTGGGGGGSASASGSSSGITVIDPNSWVVNASVSDAAISNIKVGEQVTITPQGVNTPSYGTVASVGLIAQVSNNVATFPITIDVTGSPAGYYSGLPATLSIITSVTTNAITIPILAVQGFRTSSPYVTRVTSSGKVKTPVTLGAQSGATVVVTKGLKVGDKIVETVPSIAGSGAGGSGTRRVFGGGGFGGGGFGGGGFGGGGFGGGGA